MYKTSEFARIRCVKCNEVLCNLLPGQEFKELPKCKCEVSEDYENMEIEELREILKSKEIAFSPQAGKVTLIKKIRAI